MFSKYLFSYVILLLIPLLLLGYYMYDQFGKSLIQEVSLNHLHNLSQIKYDVENKIEEMNNIALQISLTPELTPFALTNNFLNVYRSKTLLNYKMANSYIHEVLLYIRGGDFLYSSMSTYRLSMFINTINRFEQWREQQFIEDLNALSAPVIRPAEPIVTNGEAGSRKITYLVPIPFNKSSPYGVVMFLVDEADFQSLMRGTANSRGGFIAIFDGNRRIVTSSDPVQAVRHVDLQGVVSQFGGSGGSYERIMDDVNYYVSVLPSEKNGWIYVQTVPYDQMLEGIRHTRSGILRTVFFILLFGVVVMSLLFHISYKPIRNLKSYAENKWGQAAPFMNEVDRVKQAINDMIDTKDKLTERVRNSEYAVRESLMMDVLRGKFMDFDELNAFGKEYGVRLPLARHRVIVLFFPERKMLIQSRSLIDKIYALIPPDVQGFGLDFTHENKIVYIVSEADNAESPAAAWIEPFHRAAKEAANKTITIGVGNAYAEVADIGKSYIEALSALDYKLIQGNGTIIYFRHISERQHDLADYPVQEVEALGRYIASGNMEAFNALMSDMIKKVRNGQLPLFMCKCLYFDIINTINKVMYEHYDKSVIDRSKLPDVLTLHQLDTFEELARGVMTVCNEIGKELPSLIEENMKAQFLQRILEYIHQHCCTAQFSVQQMSDHFRVSSSYIGKICKERKGVTVMEYINRCRIEQAKRLLCETNHSLQEIVFMIGYNDVSSFIKKFKQHEHVTPGEYRKLFG